MSRLPAPHITQVKAASLALQARTKAENDAAPPAPQHLRLMAAEKEASAALLLKQHDQRCNARPYSRHLPSTVALWEGHYALLDKARDLRRMADEAEASTATPINTQTHRVTAAA